jgi:putative phage-type endonuclease
MATVFHNVKQRSKQWHSIRQGYITSTEVAAVMGKDKYRTAEDILSAKLGTAKEYVVSTAMCTGISYEDTAVEQYVNNYSGQDVIWVTGIVTKGILAASPDFLIGTSGVGEVKCPQFALRKTVPSNHMYQIQTCMYVTNRTWCDYVQWKEGNMRIIRVEYDPEMMQDVIQETTRFWEERVLPERNKLNVAYLVVGWGSPDDSQGARFDFPTTVAYVWGWV